MLLKSGEGGGAVNETSNDDRVQLHDMFNLVFFPMMPQFGSCVCGQQQQHLQFKTSIQTTWLLLKTTLNI